jgi:hypothetical protein
MIVAEPFKTAIVNEKEAAPIVGWTADSDIDIDEQINNEEEKEIDVQQT